MPKKRNPFQSVTASISAFSLSRTSGSSFSSAEARHQSITTFRSAFRNVIYFFLLPIFLVPPFAFCFWSFCERTPTFSYTLKRRESFPNQPRIQRRPQNCHIFCCFASTFSCFFCPFLRNARLSVSMFRFFLPVVFDFAHHTLVRVIPLAKGEGVADESCFCLLFFF